MLKICNVPYKVYCVIFYVFYKNILNLSSNNPYRCSVYATGGNNLSPNTEFNIEDYNAIVEWRILISYKKLEVHQCKKFSVIFDTATFTINWFIVLPMFLFKCI
jgi:hypothetical protein